MEQPYFLEEEDNLDSEKLDFGRYIRALKKRWWWILIITIIVTIPWVYYLKLQPPIYEATALVRFKSFTGSDMDLTRSRYTELTSRSFAEKVVSQLGLSLRMKQDEQRLSRSWIFQEFFTDRNPVPGEYVLKISAAGKYNLSVVIPDQDKEQVLESGFVEDITEGFCVTNGITFKLVSNGLEFPMEIPFSILPFRSAVQSFQSRIAVRWQDRMGTLMNLTMTDTDPRLVAVMTNRLAQIFIEESASLKNESARGRLKIIEEQTSLAEQELNEKERKLKRFKQKYNVFLDPSQKNQVNELANLDKQTQSIQSTIQALRDLLSEKEQRSLSANGNGRDLYFSDLRLVMNAISQHSVFEDHSKMLLARQKLKGLEDNWRRYAPENPKAKEILREIRQTHSQVQSIAQDKIIKLEGNLLTVNRELSRLESKSRQMPAREVELNELTRKYKVAQDAFTELLAKRQDAQISASVETEDIEILDKALVPKFPTNRDKKQNAAFGGIFGLLLGVGCVLVAEFLNKTIKSVEDVRKYLKLPVLGTIPQIDFNDVFDFQDSEKIKQIDQQLVTHDYSPTPIGEAYRSLRTNLMFTKDHGRITSLVITSNEPGDGKSFTAANLSITLAQLKSRTLVIDSDLRRGVLHNTFGVPKEPGFSNYLTDVVPLQTIIHETQIPNLSMISCGSLIPNPSELLGSHQMQRFLDEVRRKFDIIIFDSPPLNAATDAVVVGNQTDATVVVIRAGKTNRDLAKNKLDLFTNLPANVLGVILNGTTADMAHPGYSYYHY